MERLTKTYSDGTHGASDSLPCGENSYNYKNLLIEKLGKYEDAEEQGLLLRLPCKVGDSIYSVIEDGLTIIELKFSLDFYVRRKNDICKTVFLTQTEAEQKLKEMESD